MASRRYFYKCIINFNSNEKNNSSYILIIKVLRLTIDGLFNETEVAALKQAGFKHGTGIGYAFKVYDSLASMRMGMRIHPMYDPDFPPPDLVDTISTEIALYRRLTLM